MPTEFSQVIAALNAWEERKEPLLSHHEKYIRFSKYQAFLVKRTI